MTDLVALAGKITEGLLGKYALPDDIAKLVYYTTIQHCSKSPLPEHEALEILTFYDTLFARVPSWSMTGPFRTKLVSFANVPLESVYGAIQHRDPAMTRKQVEKIIGDRDILDCLRMTPYYPVLTYLVPFSIPTHRRYEHTHILGATGSGKTQLLERLIYEDIKTDAAVVVMAPKGTLIQNVARLAELPVDRILMVQPGTPINIFDMPGETDSVVGLINYVFSSILDTEITAKQTVLLNYAIRLVLKARGTLLTLRSLLTTEVVPDDLVPYLDRLSENGKDFFKTQFPNKKLYGETKEQLTWRVDLLLENTVVNTMFSAPRTSLNFKAALDQGKVILVDTSLRIMGQMGASFLGRFMLALIALAANERDARARLPCFVYIDEAALYLGENIEGILERARESKIGLTLAHQQLSQLTPTLEASILTNTSTKFVGGCSDHDARVLAKELRIDHEVLQHQRPLSFHVKVKELTPNYAVPFSILPGLLASLPRRKEMPRAQARDDIRDDPPPKQSRTTGNQDDSTSDIE